MSDDVENKATRGSIAKIILTALLDGDKYGYEICKEIERLSNGSLVLKQPSLYSSLRRMEESGFISSFWQDSAIGGRRHYYSLTSKGKDAINGSIDESNMEDLIQNLPLNDAESETFTKKTFDNENQISVASQENLFNLAPKSDIKYIDETAKESENNSFVQYDLFNQNIKFVKDSSKSVANVEAYKNKYQKMDNHGADIEPIKENNDKKDFLDEENFSIEKKEEVTDELSINGDGTSGDSSAKPITRESVYGKQDDDNFSLNFFFDYEKKKNEASPAPLDNYQKKEDNVDISKTKTVEKSDNSPNIIESPSVDSVKPDDASVDEGKIDVDKTIVWDNIGSQEADEDKSKSNDYKMIIGQLYSSSKLVDPYEENKFFTFKEIFPSAKIEEKKNAIKSKSEYAELVDTNTKTSKQQNIKVAQEQFSLQGLKLKMHDSSQNKNSRNLYVDINRLNMHTSWFVAIIIVLESLFCFIFLNRSNNIIGNQSLVYFLSWALAMGVAIIPSLENYFDRFKLVEIRPTFKQNITKMLIIFLFLCIIIFATCLICGMESLSQIDFLSYWLIPTLVSSNLVVFILIRHLLYKTGHYNN